MPMLLHAIPSVLLGALGVFTPPLSVVKAHRAVLHCSPYHSEAEFYLTAQNEV